MYGGHYWKPSQNVRFLKTRLRSADGLMFRANDLIFFLRIYQNYRRYQNSLEGYSFHSVLALQRKKTHRSNRQSITRIDNFNVPFFLMLYFALKRFSFLA